MENRLTAQRFLSGDQRALLHAAQNPKLLWESPTGSALLHLCTSQVLPAAHVSSTENTMSFVWRGSKESLHMIHAALWGDVLLKTHARNKGRKKKQKTNNLTFLQNCLGSDYSSIAEKERKKRYQLMKGWMQSTVLKARLKINSDRRKDVRPDNQLLCHWRDALGLLCSECWGTPSTSQLSWAAFTISAPCQRLQRSISPP